MKVGCCKRCVPIALCLFFASALAAKRSSANECAGVAVVASAADAAIETPKRQKGSDPPPLEDTRQNSGSDASASSPPSLPPISNATVSPIQTDEDIMDEEEASATVPLDDSFITGDVVFDKNNPLPLEPGGGEGILDGLLATETDAGKASESDMPGVDNPMVGKYRDYYLAPERVKWLTAVLEKAEQYRLYVRARLKERGMPAYLEYLPVVESSYKTNARSKAGALGLWQFMANSTRGLLKRDDFVDERLDPWRSTDAALSKLMANYKQFGDWPLALAAYNCGAGAMQGVIRRNPGKDFWALAQAGSLRRETSQYVPRLIAIADICENTSHYGVDIPTAKRENGESTNPRAGSFDYADTNKAVSLKRLASSLKIDEGMLISMNPALYREITPPHCTYSVRVPEGMGEAASSALEESPPYHFQTRYTVVAGDSLWKISRAFRVTVSAICDANSMSENSTLKVGRVLYIPN